MIFSKFLLSGFLLTLMHCNSYASEYQYHKTQFIQPQKESRGKDNDGYVAMYAYISVVFKNYRAHQHRCSVHYPQNASEKQYADSVPKMLSDISNCNSKLYGVPINEKMARDYARSDLNLEFISNMGALSNFKGNANPHSREDAQSCSDNIVVLKAAVMPFTMGTGYPAAGWCKK